MTSSNAATAGPARADAQQPREAESITEQPAPGGAAPTPFQLLPSDDAFGVCAVDGTCS